MQTAELSNDTIHALAVEARNAGDDTMVSTCHRAMDGDADALEECARVIQSALDMDDGES